MDWQSHTGAGCYKYRFCWRLVESFPFAIQTNSDTSHKLTKQLTKHTISHLTARVSKYPSHKMATSLTTQPPSFTPFPNLPPELQLLVWEAALPGPSVHYIHFKMNMFLKEFSQEPELGPSWVWAVIVWLDQNVSQTHEVSKTIRAACVTSNDVVTRHWQNKGVRLLTHSSLEELEKLTTNLKNSDPGPTEADVLGCSSPGPATVHVDDLLIFKTWEFLWPSPLGMFEKLFMPSQGIRHLGVQYDSVAEYEKWSDSCLIGYVVEIGTTVEAFYIILPPDVFEDAPGHEAAVSVTEDWDLPPAESIVLDIFRDPRKTEVREGTLTEFWLETKRFLAVPWDVVESRAPVLAQGLIRDLGSIEDQIRESQSNPDWGRFGSITRDLPEISWLFMTWKEL
jgi:2EXR family protein